MDTCLIAEGQDAGYRRDCRCRVLATVAVRFAGPSSRLLGRTSDRPPACSGAYVLAPILNILVLHTGQVPSVAGRPFFIVICFASLISRWVLHFMQ